MDIAEAHRVQREAGWKLHLGSSWFATPSQGRRLAGTDRENRRLGGRLWGERARQPPQVKVGRHLIRPGSGDPSWQIGHPRQLEHPRGRPIDIPTDHVPAAPERGQAPRFEGARAAVSISETHPGTVEHGIPEHLEPWLSRLNRW